MNCNTCRYELSQCLDGRLASGRRAVVMAHTSACEPCAEFWNELQAAQRVTLQLPREEVSEGFREQLFARIRAGEGTPDAVFREPVPVLTKARYTLTGAAAAAALLLCGMWLNENDSSSLPVTDSVANSNSIADHQPAPPAPTETRYTDTYQVPTMFNAAQPLTANLFASEAAHQIEVRYDSVNYSLAQLEIRNDVDLLERIVTEANDLHDIGCGLLDLRDRDHLSFRNPEVEADLRLVTRMLGRVRWGGDHSLDVVQTWVAPAIHDGKRLGTIRGEIMTTATNPRAEATVLIHITAMRPQVFSKLFRVIGPGDTIHDAFGLSPQNVFLLEDTCGTNYVAPLSQVEWQTRGIQPRVR